MHNFSMRVDLSDFFTDARSCSLVLIDSSWENVKDLQDHIQKLFLLKDISLLSKDGCYLPPKESIKVLKSTDSLKAFKLEVSPSSEGETNRKRRKRSVDREVEFASSTPNNAKRSKNKNSLLQVDEKKHSTREAKRFQSDQVGEISKVKELSVNKTTATNDKTCSSTNYPKLSEGTNSILQLEEQASNQESEILQNELEVDVSTIKELSENKSANNRSLKAKQSIHKGSISNNHIIFQEEEPQAREVTITETKSQPSKLLSAVSFRCPLLELDSNNVRVFKLPRKAVPVEIIENIVIPAPQSATTSQKDVLQIVNENEKSSQENVPLADIPSSRPLTPTPPNKSLNVTKESPQLKDKSSMELQSIAEQSFDLDSDDDVMVLDDTNPDDSDSDVQTVPLKDGFNEIIADMLQNAAPLKDLPNIGDTVIFKLPRSKGAALSPTTENIAGTCSYVNRRTKSISISLIAYADQNKSIILNQYSKQLDVSSDSEPILNINFKEMIEPKVIVSSVD